MFFQIPCSGAARNVFPHISHLFGMTHRVLLGLARRQWYQGLHERYSTDGPGRAARTAALQAVRNGAARGHGGPYGCRLRPAPDGVAGGPAVA
ncbi:hypothetical protein SXCC_03927 [Gluconacetobacter sp. SXCC-1]|nr:hypothetical protein SXCC_03927 [Gluconacetobacter sp. SXCC-1]